MKAEIMKPFSNLGAALVLAAAVTNLPAESVEGAELEALRKQLQQLEQQLRILARQIEIKEEALAAAPPSAKVTITDKGFSFASADNANVVKLRGLVQLDSRFYFGDNGTSNDAFVLRRARLIAEGQFARNYGFQLVSEFGGAGGASILDANFTVAVAPALQLKFGKFKSPVGLEQLQSDSWTFFNERSIVTNLVPNRDLGVQASGDLWGGKANYAAGVFGGVPDGGSTNNADFDTDKEFVARLAAMPFKETTGALQGLTVGLAGSSARMKTASGRASGYRTDGQQTFFAYNAATVADGRSWRLSPQADFRRGSFGALGEYVMSAVNVRPGAAGARTELRHRAWQVAAGWVLTGEDSSAGGVVPRTNFDPAAATWGAVELAARYAELTIDDAAFPLYASPSASASRATSFGLGLNWYLSKAAMLKLDCYRSHFGLSTLAPAVATTPVLRQDEKAFISRFQLAF